MGTGLPALGRSRGGFSTKIHVSVDGLGNPLRFILTGGQRHDITQAEELIAGYAGEQVLADKGYEQEFREHIGHDSGHSAPLKPEGSPAMTGICTGSAIWSNAS